MSVDNDETATPAERRKARQRAHVIDAGLELFERHGFDNTSTDAIAEAGDISPRTFFRYFESKADLVIDTLSEGMAAIGEFFIARPADEPAPIAMCEAAVELLNELGGAERFIRCISIMVTTPALQARLVTRSPLEEVLKVATQERYPDLEPHEAQTLAAMGSGLMRQPMALLALTGDGDVAAAELRRLFDSSLRLWTA